MSHGLGGFSLLEELGEEERATLEGYLEERSFDADTLLFATGEESSEMLFVLEGRVTVESDGHPVATLGKGQTLGGVGLSLVGMRQCRVWTDEPTRALSLDRLSYHRLRVDAPATALALQEAVVREFAAAVREMLEGLHAFAADESSGELDGGSSRD